MKKIVAIALLSIHLFTICGHIVLYQYVTYRTDKIFNEQIGNNRYNVNDLVEIKLAGHTDLFKSWDSFEAISGQVQFKNACYNYVKLKLTTDTIYLMCVPNYEKTRLFNQNIIQAKEITDMPVKKKEHVPYGKILTLNSFSIVVACFKFSPPVATLRINNNYFNTHPVNCFLSIPEQPPKMG